jgi:hypothetical protein
MADPKKPILQRRPRIQQRTDLSLIMGLGLLAFFVVVGFMLNIGPRDNNLSNKPSAASSQSR